MESYYSKEVDRLRNMSKENVKRVKVSKNVNNSYKLVAGTLGWLVGEREKDGVKQLKVFTGTRIWFVPEDKCEILTSI